MSVSKSDGLHVLVVEDDPSLKELLRLVLELEESVATVDAAVTAEEAMGMCRLTPPDLVITDSAIAGSNEVEPGVQIRELYPSMRIISFSGKQGSRPWADLEVSKTGKGIDAVIKAVRDVAHTGSI